MDELAARWPELPNLFSFGGGTMLAARWKHRESTDIDILAARGSGLRSTLEGNQANWFAAACEAAGGLEIEYLPATATITVSFPEGQWDLSELDPPLPGMEALAEVDGTPIQALSNSQILAGKLLHRAFEAVPRDLFDLAVAATLDRPALDQGRGGMRSGRRRIAHPRTAVHGPGLPPTGTQRHKGDGSPDGRPCCAKRRTL